MKIRRFLVACGVICLVPAVLFVGVRAYSVSPYTWAVSPVVFYLNPANGDVSAAAAESAIQSALATWSTQSGSAFRYQYGGRVNDTNTSNDGRNVVIFRNSSSGGAIASTYSWWSGGSRIDSDVIFWDAGWRFFTGSSGCSDGAYVEDVATHELGHSLGLKHSSVTDATMYSTYTRCSTWMRTIGSDDLKGLQLLYPGTGASIATNTAPSVTIVSPVNGATVTAGASTSFSGSASDSQQGNLTSQLVWRSNLDGQIGTGGSFTRALTAGTHTITATVTDSGGLTSQRSITVYAVAASLTAATLTATAKTNSDGVRYTKLVWSGLTSAKVDVYRNAVKVSIKANDGSATDPISSRGTYTYKLCNQGASTCTNQVSVTF